jgi:hypothetical protein
MTKFPGGREPSGVSDRQGSDDLMQTGGPPMSKKSKPDDGLIMNCTEVQCHEGVETLLLKGGIEKIVEPKGKGWKRVNTDDWNGWDAVWERKARR